MAQPIQQVQSGEVIKASLMNQIIQALANLDTRVTKLEGGAAASTAGPPHISDFTPRIGLREGDLLTVSGQNLWAAGMNSVYIDLNGALTPVAKFTTQSDTLLVFNIPPVFAQASGTFVTLRVVSPTQGSDSVSFSLQPAAVVIPSGDVRVQLSSSAGTTFNAPGQYTLNYALNANITMGDTFDLEATISASGWTVTVDNSSVFIAAAQSPSQPTIVRGTLQLTIPGGASGSGNLVLTVTSRLDPTGLKRSSPTAVIPVGGTVLLSSGIGIVPTPKAGDTDQNGNLLVPAGNTGLTIVFLTTVTTAGSYLVTRRFDNDSGNWNANVSSPVQIPTANVPKPVSVVVKANAGANPSNLYLKVTSATDSTIVSEVFYPVRVS